MAFLFGRRQARQDLARSARDLLPRMWDTIQQPKVEDEISKLLSQIKITLQGSQDADSSPENVAQLVSSIIQEDLLYHLAHTLHLLPFESRKDSQTIFSYVLRFKPPLSSSPNPPAVDYVVGQRPEIVVELCKGYNQRESVMPCGVILREALKHEDIAVIILYDQGDDEKFNIETVSENALSSGNGIFWQFFRWIDRGSFETSADAFTTFREVITRHKQIASHYLAVNFDLFFSKYHEELVGSSSYVTKRQSIKLLGEILLDRANYNIMTVYVDQADHLKMCMNLLKDDRRMIQYEAFHVFKVFVANPNKSFGVQKILINNREKLLKFLPGFLDERGDDDQFSDEKSFLIRQIETLPPAPVERR
ncbi:MAG: hypothetical protein MMC23_008616 [Stictis urceolatum]|nr:hypothetical protein [Stictis urceolata]